MDAPLTLARLIEEFEHLLNNRDYEGGEELLSSALSHMPRHEAYLHFQLGKLYARWNKMSSAVSHLGRAAEIANQKDDEVLAIQIIEEFRSARKRQAEQAP